MRFRSTILEADGSTVTTELEAVDEQTLHGALANEGRALLRVVPVSERVTAPVDVQLSPKRLLVLTQALHEALDAGVPLLATFDAVADQEPDDRVAGMLTDLGARVAAGQSLADSLEAYPRAFDRVYCSLVRVGEQSGSLPEVLESIASFLEWRIEIAGTVKQAMIYPAVVLAAGYGMILFMLAFVIPRLGDVLSKIGNELPAASRMLIGASSLVAANVHWILLASAGLVVGFVLLLRNARFLDAVMRLLGALPVVRGVVSTLAIAQFARTFGVMLRSGLTMTTAMQMGAKAVALPNLRQSIQHASGRILGGARLGEALEAEQVLPPVAMSMVKVGEEAGRLPITFERLSRLYDREVKSSVKKALSLLEPIVTVALGLAVGGVAVLVVTTIYSAMKGIGR